MLQRGYMHTKISEPLHIEQVRYLTRWHCEVEYYVLSTHFIVLQIRFRHYVLSPRLQPKN